MVELAHKNPSELKLGYGGDTLNTAIYLNRLARGKNIAVDYVTALGDDDYSNAMLAVWKREGLGTDLVARLPGHLPGLYTIRTDCNGERSFNYWRDQSAARKLLEAGRPAFLAKRLRDYDLLYLSGITLSILDKAQQQRLIDVIDTVRDAGGKIAFDSNFRPAGWRNLDEARSCFDGLLARSDIAFPTFDDEHALMGSTSAEEVAARHHQLGVKLVLVKLGAKGCLLSSSDGIEIIETQPVDQVVDSTAAGDSFNAGFLATLLQGKTAKCAAMVGHHLAAQVLRYRGAIIPEEVMPNMDKVPVEKLP